MEKKIIDYIKQHFNFGELIDVPSYPVQGLSGYVFFLNFKDKEVVVKYGDSVENDYKYLKLIHDRKVDIKVPEVYGYFIIENTQVLLLEKINGKLFGEVKTGELPRYFDSIVETLNNLHKLKNRKSNWKTYLLSIFNGDTINWSMVYEREAIDSDLLRKSISWVINEINNLNFKDEDSALLHTDFNNSNLFIDENTFKIIGVIDWEEATFGDPVYDIARFHMHLWHREAEENIVDEFFVKANLDEQQIKNEKIYFIAFIIHYLAYYSESVDDARAYKIKKHEDFLRELLDKQ